MNKQQTATWVGASALLMWGTLALTTTWSGQIPPFQLTSMVLGLATLLTLVKWGVRREPVMHYLKQPLAAWAVGIWGIFGFHFFYFQALKGAPPAEANMIIYLWPLLIVLFSAFLPGERLLPQHVLGAGLGLVGSCLLMMKGGAFAWGGQHAAGYAAALMAALSWSSYSVLSRRHVGVPTDTVGGFCAVAAGLAALCHWAFESTVWPMGFEWLVLLYMGVGPVGAAFFVWDHGVKHGSIKMLGTLSYLTPLLSTLLLVSFGKAQASPHLAWACGLIIGGAVIGSLKSE